MSSRINDAPQPLLEARGLTKHFVTGTALRRYTVRAVQDANLKLYPGRVTALVGESGSGKSTIARMLVRLYEPTSGEILYEGRNILGDKGRKALLEYRSHVQMIFQDPFSSLNPVRRIRAHLERPLLIHGKAKRGKLREQVNELLERVALTPVEEFADKFPHQLSGGQRQRVAIARALAVEPRVILADEPVSMLDVSIRLGILNLMAKLRNKQNNTFLNVTHDISSARYFADETLDMYARRIVEGGERDPVIQNAKHPYTQLLLSAVPNPEKGLRTGVTEDRGEVPDLTQVGVGCPFAPRCKHVMDICRREMPGVTQLSANRWTRCYLYEDVA